MCMSSGRGPGGGTRPVGIRLYIIKIKYLYSSWCVHFGFVLSVYVLGIGFIGKISILLLTSSNATCIFQGPVGHEIGHFGSLKFSSSEHIAL